ncbi:MAG: hypothetical protein AB7S26_11165 [Sandaracinaceae bacterium]
MTPYLPCLDCERHVRADAGRCPFCDVTLGTTFRAQATYVTPRGTTRALVMAFRTSALAASATAAGCGASTALDTSSDGGAAIGAGRDAGRPDGGADPTPVDAGRRDAGGTDAGARDAGARDAGFDGGDPGGPVILYGVPGLLTDAGSADDAGGGDAGGINALYGGPSGP